jgi:sulfur-carrier protein
MASVLFFAAARRATGHSSAQIDGATVDEVLDAAGVRFGKSLRDLLPYCTVMVDGQSTTDHHVEVTEASEIALLPPVSGG